MPVPVMRYTRLVRLGKNLLWLIIASMIAVVVWIASDNTGEGGARIVFSNIEQSEALQNVMLKPNYQGLDKHNKPYTVTAEKATQKDTETVVLNTLRADMTGDDGKWLALNAGSGELNTTKKLLALGDGIEVFYDGGYTFRTLSANININEGSAKGEHQVEGQGPAASLQADNFTILERGNIIRFNGSVKVTLYQ
jgi:lipopolysaccharide export system protein LptC